MSEIDSLAAKLTERLRDVETSFTKWREFSDLAKKGDVTPQGQMEKFADFTAESVILGLDSAKLLLKLKEEVDRLGAR